MATTAARRTDPALLALRAAAGLTLLVILGQFLSAGGFLGPRGDESWVDVHEVGTIVLHVTSGLAALAALAHRRGRPEAPSWPAVVAVVLFVLTFAQAWFGSHGMIALHVPGAMICTVLAVWLAAWSFSSPFSSSR